MRSLFAPALTVHAHCDLPCGVYDPAQAKLEAQSVKACMEKYHASDDHDFKTRAITSGVPPASWLVRPGTIRTRAFSNGTVINAAARPAASAGQGR